MMPTPDLALTLRLILMIAAFGLLLSTREYVMRPVVLQDKGLLSWQVQRVALGRMLPSWLLFCLHGVLGYPQIFVLLAFQVLCACWLLLTASMGIGVASLTLVCVWGCALTQMLLTLRSSFGGDGSDQMFIIIFVTLGFSLAFENPLMLAIGFWFLSFQCALSYCTAGVAKVFSPTWRSGEALPAILATERFGYFPLARWLRHHPRVTWLITWQTLGIELLFPLALVGPRWLTLLLLLWGLFFHLANVLVMGLARFLWAFAACYPAIWWCSGALYLRN